MHILRDTCTAGMRLPFFECEFLFPPPPPLQMATIFRRINETAHSSNAGNYSQLTVSNIISEECWTGVSRNRGGGGVDQLYFWDVDVYRKLRKTGCWTRDVQKWCGDLTSSGGGTGKSVLKF